MLSSRPLISGNYVAMSTKGWEAIASGSDSVPRRRIDFEDTEVDVDAVHRELVDAGRLAPVDLGGDDERRWVDCELASFAENRLGDRTHPFALDEATRRSWQERATEGARRAARTANDYVEENPWQIIGAVALVALAVGILLGRGRD